MFITFEGLDFSGKTTQIKKLVSYLENIGKSITLLREPGGVPICESIRELILDPSHKEMDIQTELLLYSASRAQLVEEKLKSAIETSDIVICDRFFDSTTAYQGYGRGISLDVIRTLNTFVSQNIVPDITFLVDINVEESFKRRFSASREEDRIEQSGKAFFERVRSGYLEIAKNEPRFNIINGEQDIEQIHLNIINSLKLKE